MLKLAALCITTLTASLAAQCNPGTLTGPDNATNSGNPGGMLYFNLTAAQTITITEINFRAGPNTTTTIGGLEIYMGPSNYAGNETNSNLWTLVDTVSNITITLNAAGVTPGVRSNAVLTTGISLSTFPNGSPKTYAMALRAIGAWNHGYSNPGTVTNPISTPELTLTSGSASNVPWLSPVFSPRHVNADFVYTCGGTSSTVAGREKYGSGCYDQRTSFGEVFGNPSTSYDLGGQTTTFSFTGISYAVSATTTNSYVAPSGTATPLATLALGGDTASVATALGGSLPFNIIYPRVVGGVPSLGIATDLEVCASGFITPVDPTGMNAPLPAAQAGDLSPTIAELFNTGIERWVPHWQTMAPGTGGSITAELDTNGDLVISWNAVPLTGLATTLTTMQVAFSQNGDVQYRIDSSTTSPGAGGAWPIVTGWSLGQGALNNEIDVSAIPTNPFATASIDYTALDLDLDAQPKLGTNPNFVITGFDPVQAAVGVLLLNFQKSIPPVDLGFVGMAGCEGHVDPFLSMNMGIFLTFNTSPALRSVWSGGIPNVAQIDGLIVNAQAGVLQLNCANGAPCNALGAIVSNGLTLTFGSL